MMRIKNLLPSLTLILLLVISSSFGQAASTPSYLGNTTWSVYITDNTIDPFMVHTTLTLTGGITKVGDNYYSFQGAMMYGTTLMALSGGGVLANGALILSVSESMEFAGGDRDSGVMHFTLNQSDLNGSFTEIHNVYVPGTTPRVEQGYFAGTLTRTGSMLPLVSASTGALSLLLE
jgi:hypothetical protein